MSEANALNDLRILSTAHRLLYDVMSILTNKECDGKSFEIGCKCKVPAVQEQLSEVMTSIFKHTPEIEIKTKEEDYAVCVLRSCDDSPKVEGAL